MAEECLHLFTSNIRELYVADAVDLLAVPHGAIYQFRYQSDHVQDSARLRWNRLSGGLEGVPVLVYFSVQHASNFHRAAYIPLRHGQVVDAWVEGSTYVVRFRVLGYAAFRPLKPGRENFQLVQDFSEAVRTQLRPSYPDYVGEDGAARGQRRSATLGTPALAEYLDDALAEGLGFEQVVRYVAAALGPQFPRIYFRLASIWKDDKTEPESLSERGCLELVAGNHYRIEVAHFQAEPPSAATVTVELPVGLTLLSQGEYPVRSRYDVVPVRFFVPFRDDEQQGEIILAVKGSTVGASVRLPVRISPSATHRVVYPALAIGGGFVVLMPSILGSSTGAGWRLLIAAVGAVVVGAGLWARRSRGLSG